MPDIRVNGATHSVDVDDDTPLLWVLRDELGLTGTKYGCGIAQCGACTVHLDGQPTLSCTTPVSAVGEREVTTIEALAAGDDPAAQAVQTAWRSIDVVQCGYCQSGQIMAAAALLASTPDPDDAAIDAALDGNVCRCATYARIREGVKRAADIMRASA